MNEQVTKELNDALSMLGVILVSGDAVDFMASAKQKIRKAISILGEEVEQSNG